MQGKFIVFEGPEGAGKTSVLDKVYTMLKDEGYNVMKTREPGGIPIAEKIRSVIHDVDHTNMDSKTEALLYAAARRQHLAEKVIPALERGVHVLCDRFVHSSLAYQGHARGLGMEAVMGINAFAIDGHMPDKVLFFDLPIQVGLARVFASEEREVNRLDLEAESFHHRVKEGYDMLIAKDPQQFVIINADQTREEVFNDTIQVMRDLLR